VLTVAGAALLAAGSGVSLVRTRGCRGAAGRPPAASKSQVSYVDHEGWMLTANDKQKLVGAPGSR
jgi:hypothetical protein